jgi:hypothetical protein
MNIDIVIVNWNSCDQLRKCVSSLARFGHEKIARLVVVDNGSIDGSAEDLRELGLPLQLIRNHENLGFARACNQGAAVCDARYLLFLNPDTEVFDKSLIMPLRFMENVANSDVGICGIQLVDGKKRIAHTCARFPTLSRFVAQAFGLNKIPGLRSSGVHMLDWDHSETSTVDHVIGAFFFVRRTLFEALDGFDERYFVYLEDVDFSFRARRRGWKSVYLAEAQAYHAGGGTSRQIKDTRLFYSLRSRLLYGLKHFSRWQVWTLFVLTLVAEPFSRSAFSLFRGGRRDVSNTWRGYGKLYRDLPNISNNTGDKTQE